MSRSVRPPWLSLVVVALCCGVAPYRALAESVPVSVTVTAQFSSRTSLHVPTHSLQFDIVHPAEPAVASVMFTAGARTVADAPVLLLFEMTDEIRDIDGRLHGDTTVTLINRDDGMSAELTPRTPTIARRWIGSGLRTGYLMFALRTGTAGRYRVPIRVTLTAP